MVDVIEEALHIKQKHAAFEAESVCSLDVVEEGESSVEAGGESSSSKLCCRDEFVFHNVVLEPLCDDLLQ